MISSGIITNLGNQVICEHIYKNSTNYVLYIAYGTGTTTPTVYDTIMEAEEARKLATVIDTANRLYITASWVISDDPITISEIGVFDALAGGNLVYHGVAAYCAITFATGNAYEPGDSFAARIVLNPESG